MMHVITITDPGILSTLQDLGRWGYQHKGYSVGGAMDHFALKVANMLVGNDFGEACLEMTFKGIEAIFRCKAMIAITGADMRPSLNGEPLEMWSSYVVDSGDILKFQAAQSGMRTYMSIKGGFDFKPFLGSKSTSVQEKLGSDMGQALHKGSVLPIVTYVRTYDNTPKRLRRSIIPDYYQKNYKRIRVIGGPFEDYFTHESIQTFYKTEYTVGHGVNRVGCRLEGQPLKTKGEAGRLISVGMTTGSIQVPGRGLPIILCAERRTHGGYPVIATVASVDMPKVAQCRPGDIIKFVRITLEEAHSLLKEQENMFKDSSLMEVIEPEEILMRLPDMVDCYYHKLFNEFF